MDGAVLSWFGAIGEGLRERTGERGLECLAKAHVQVYTRGAFGLALWQAPDRSIRKRDGIRCARKTRSEAISILSDQPLSADVLAQYD